MKVLSNVGIIAVSRAFMLLLSSSSIALAAPGETIRVSVDSNGTQGNRWSDFSAISADGRFVAFESSASNLVDGGSDDHSDVTPDVFVHDRQTGATSRISVSSSGVQGNRLSTGPSISDDGRFVALWSYASNLVDDDTNFSPDVFVHDRETGVTSRVSVDSNGAQGNNFSNSSGAGSISADGRFVAFESLANNLVDGDTNASSDIFVHDRETGVTTRVSVDSNGAQGNNNSYRGAISADGRFLSFESDASNLVDGDFNNYRDIFVHDRLTGATSRVSVGSTGVQSDDSCFDPAISADGRFVAFVSNASNLVDDDTNGVPDVFVHDRDTGVTSRVSVDSNGVQGNDRSATPSISADGRLVAFWSFASDLVHGDTNGAADVFVHDRVARVTQRVSVDSGGLQGDGGSIRQRISADGRFVAFSSVATNLVDLDTNGQGDVFVHERRTPALTTWEFSGEIVATAGLPTVAPGDPFRVLVTFDTEAPYTTSSGGGYEPGAAYRFDARGLSLLYDLPGMPPILIMPSATSSNHIVQWDNSGVSTTTDLPAADGIRFQIFEPIADGENADISLAGTVLDIFNGPGLPTTPDVRLLDLEQRYVRWSPTLDEFALGEISGVRRRLDLVDTDSDAVPDEFDNCPDRANPGQADADSDGVGDACDFDAPVSTPVGTTPGDTPVSTPPGPVEPPQGSIVELNLVLLVHGWNSNPDVWANGLAERIRSHIETNIPDPDSWFVAIVDWEAWANTWLPSSAHGRANEVADFIFEGLSGLHSGNVVYRHVHLVGHSAGSQVIDALARRFKCVPPNTCDSPVGVPAVHLTFLDPYHPNGNAAPYGEHGDWAENYVDMRPALGVLSDTNLSLSSSLNLDITGVDPDQQYLSPQRVHAWPYAFYSATATTESTWSFGFSLSREFGGQPRTGPDPIPAKDTLTQIPSHEEAGFGRGTTLCFAGPDPAPPVVCTEEQDVAGDQVLGDRIFADHHLGDIARYSLAPVPVAFFSSAVSPLVSPTGTVVWNPMTEVLTLTNASPAWIKFQGDVIEPIDTLSFDFEFDPIPGSNGLLSVFVDDALVFSKRQQFSETGSQSTGLIAIGELPPGPHFLAFRLDMLTDTPASVQISNFRNGVTEVERTVNIPPTAVINGVEETYLPGATIVLDGGSSFDPDALPSPLSFLWTQINGPSVPLSSASSMRASLTALEPGIYEFQLRVRDGHSFSTPAQVAFSIEDPNVGGATPPVITHTTTGSSGANGWFVGDVTVTWTVSDGGSAISSSSGCDSLVVSEDTDGLVLVCTATNSVGTSSEQVEIRRDTSNPTISITIPSNGATYTQGANVSASYRCSDSPSGMASCTGTVANGASLNTSTLGAGSFTVTATDIAGNSTSSQVTYQVVAAPEEPSGGGGGGALNHWALLYLSVLASVPCVESSKCIKP